MRVFVFGLFFLLSSNVFSNIEKDIGCFSSASGKINVKFVEIYDLGATLAYVKYKAEKKPIPLILSATNEIILDDDRPSEITSKWIEFIGGVFNGEYTVVSQGARYYKFKYKNINGKEVQFSENLNAYDSNQADCIWN